MDPIFAWIEGSALSQWVRGSDCICAFPTIVTLHNIGLAFLAGGGIVIDLRLIGFASDMPLKPMARFFPLLWLAFAVNAVTGTLLLIGYPTKALTNPLFYVKLSLVALAVGLVYRIASDVLRAPGATRNPSPPKLKGLAVASLAAWVAPHRGRPLPRLYAQMGNARRPRRLVTQREIASWRWNPGRCGSAAPSCMPSSIAMSWGFGR